MGQENIDELETLLLQMTDDGPLVTGRVHNGRQARAFIADEIREVVPPLPDLLEYHPTREGEATLSAFPT